MWFNLTKSLFIAPGTYYTFKKSRKKYEEKSFAETNLVLVLNTPSNTTNFIT